MPFSGSVTLPSAGTYYIIIDTDNSGSDNTPFGIEIESLGAGPANDLPCNAEPLAMGTPYTGDNTCAGSSGEPTTPTCWTGGTRNTVWFSIVAPASGSLKIRTALQDITDTQIALYSGTCGATMTQVECNDDQPACGDNEYSMSEIEVSSLTSGITYYIVVDGTASLYGTFTILVIDGAEDFPSAPGQDCGSPVPVCGQQFVVGNPGYQAVGNTCDFDGYGSCLESGERGSAWYSIPVVADGNLTFSLVPNDYTGDAGDETDYDFAIWKISGTDAVTCADISSGEPPLRCNYSIYGVTGLNGTGDAPGVYAPDFNGAFESELPVLSGETYVLIISNFTNSQSGFDIDFNAGSPINYPVSPTSLIWTGGAGNSDWFTPMNWGNCAVYPDEDIDVIIPPASVYLPVINRVDPNDATNARCKSLTINSSASLTINTGYVLELYGDFENNGNLTAADGSTVLLSGGNDQNLDGNMVGASNFGFFTVTKSGGGITLLDNLEVAGNLTTSNATSLLDADGKTITCGGNVSLTATTYTHNNGLFVLYGSNSQTITSNANVFYDFSMQKTGGTATLSGDLTISNTLTLTTGIISTGSDKVVCTSVDASKINGHNSESYINGNLRKSISSNTSTYPLPVGDATRYALVEITNNNLTGISYLDADFTGTFSNTGSLEPSLALDGSIVYETFSNEGIWEINPDASPTGGTYTIKAYFNDGGGGSPFANLEDNLFAVVKRPSASSSAADWAGESTGSISAEDGSGRMVADGFALRSGISSFSHHGIVRAPASLAVELLSFDTHCSGEYLTISWVTASEINSSFFILEEAAQYGIFNPIGRVDSKGNSSIGSSYTFRYKPDIQGLKYYRLVDVEWNGTRTTYGPIVSDCKNQNLFDLISAVQTSSNQDVSVLYSAETNAEVQINIYDLLGNLVYESVFLSEGSPSAELILHLSSLSKGVYSVSGKSDNESCTLRLVIY
ncbi:MAG: T9SS type A sorting domain-containing protein [Bacteroidetes bacterium]|nr:T9SS type A sorting domain-containing protein [Bacteroidota bacterium]MBU1719138.1 T9SS type A sorting domain-containing protein [Bacteroidota bacterium]